MMAAQPLRLAATAAVLAALATGRSCADPALAPVLTPDIMAGLGNSSLFTRWRPRSHFLSPHSWMNDPCGPVYDPTTQTYHLHYQFNPNHVNWGNISWGHATSTDLFHWTDVTGWKDDAAVSLAAGNKYSSAPLSVFTGTTQPVNLEGQVDGTLLSFLTGIHHLPTNWKIPYEEGTENQAMFISHDSGTTWDQVDTVIAAPPEGWNITGWRDPSFFPSPLLDELTGSSSPQYYMVLGSGLKGPSVPSEFPDAQRPGYIGPRIPLYSAPAHDLTNWTFLGALWEPAANASLGEPDVTGSWGYNFEVSSFFALDVPSTKKKAWFVGMGSEGGNTTSHWRESWALWNCGDVQRRDNGSVAFEPNSGGALDWGIAYAQATWEDAEHEGGPRRVMWGWANEDVVAEYAVETTKQLGYQGAMTLPMELYVKETEGVMNCDSERGDGNVCVERGGGGSVAQTLGMRPLPDVLDLMRQDSEVCEYNVGKLTGMKHAAPDLGDSYELKATLSSLNAGARAGIVVARSPDDKEFTTVYFDSTANKIGIDRQNSSLLPHFNSLGFEGHFEPYVVQDGTEDVEFHLVLDGSLLEVWVNERFSMTARIYPSRKDSTGLSFFVDDSVEATWSNVKVWKGLAKAWPERPADTSVQLKWDSPEESGNYTWWAGY